MKGPWTFATDVLRGGGEYNIPHADPEMTFMLFIDGQDIGPAIGRGDKADIELVSVDAPGLIAEFHVRGPHFIGHYHYTPYAGSTEPYPGVQWGKILATTAGAPDAPLRIRVGSSASQIRWVRLA